MIKVISLTELNAINGKLSNSDRLTIYYKLYLLFYLLNKLSKYYVCLCCK